VINLVYIGDYDALTNDFLLQHGGFFGASRCKQGKPGCRGARLATED